MNNTNVFDLAVNFNLTDKAAQTDKARNINLASDVNFADEAAQTVGATEIDIVADVDFTDESAKIATEIVGGSRL